MQFPLSFEHFECKLGPHYSLHRLKDWKLSSARQRGHEGKHEWRHSQQPRGRGQKGGSQQSVCPPPALTQGQSSQPKESPRGPMVGRGNTEPALTFRFVPLQPHFQFLSMFRYQFRGHLGRGRSGNKNRKAFSRRLCTDPRRNRLCTESVFPGGAKSPRGQEHGAQESGSLPGAISMLS